MIKKWRTQAKRWKTAFLSIAAMALLGLGLSAGCGSSEDPPALVTSGVGTPAVNEDGTMLVLTFSDMLDGMSIPAPTAFTVNSGAVIISVGTVSISGSTVTLALVSAVTQGETITVAYAKPASNMIKSDAGSELESFTATAVANNSTNDEEPFLIGYTVLNVDATREMENAVKFAAADINAAGGNVRLVDTDIDDERIFRRGNSVAQLRKFVDMGIKGLIGTSSSITSVEILPFVTENKLVTIAPAAISERITELNEEVEGQHYFFRTIPHNDYQAEVLAEESEGKVAIVYRNDEYGRDLNTRIGNYLESLGRPEPVSAALPPFNNPFGVRTSDAQVEEWVDMVERVDGIRQVDSVIVSVYLTDARILEHLQDSTVVPADAKYYLDQLLTYSDHLHSYIAAEDEDPESDEVKARLQGVKGVISYPHSQTHSHDELRAFECRFSHDIEHVEEALHYTTYTYDALVVMALAALKAGSTDPSVYVKEVAGVTKGGTLCSSYAQCRGLLTDGDPSNDDIDYDGLSGPLELNGETGNVGDAFFAVYTYDGEGGRERNFVEVRDGEILHPDNVREPPERPLRECP